MATLGLSPEATTLAGAAGSIIIKYVNSSYYGRDTRATSRSTAERFIQNGDPEARA
jgi:hypothetical protein